MKKGIILFLILFTTTVILANGKTIFVVQSYNSQYKWDADYKAGLEMAIPSGNTLVYFEMDTKRIPAAQHQKMADIAYEKFLEIKPDIVVLGDDAALKMIGPKLANIKTPVVYLGINNNPRNYFTDLPLNMTGVLERPILKRSVIFIKEIIPTAKKGLIMFDSSLTAQIIKKEYFNDADTITIGEVEVDIVLIDDFATWKEKVTKSKGGYNFIVAGLYQTIKDDSGKVMNMDDVIKWSSINTPIPIFGFWDFSIGKDKVIGGYVLEGKDMGIRAGKMVAEIIKGSEIRSIRPVFESDGAFIFSKTQLEKWKLKLTPEMLKKAEYIE